MKSINAIKVSANELDKLVRATWPEKAEFEWITEFEYSNEMTDIWEDVSEEDHDPIEFGDWLTSHKHSSIGPYQLLCALVEKRALQPGNYIIDICW